MALRITNVVATAQLNCQLDLRDLDEKWILAEYHPERFSGLLLRTLYPFNGHCQLYRNGKVTVNGATSEKDAISLLDYFVREVKKVGYDCHADNFTIVNIVASFDLMRSLSLPVAVTAVKRHFPKTSWEPEIFPGFSTKMNGCTAVVFRSGKVNLLGAKNFEIIQEAHTILSTILQTESIK